MMRGVIRHNARLDAARLLILSHAHPLRIQPKGFHRIPIEAVGEICGVCRQPLVSGLEALRVCALCCGAPRPAA